MSHMFSHDSISLMTSCPSCCNQLSRALPALCPHCRSHLPAVSSASLCESSSSLLASKQRLMFSPGPFSPKYLTSTPVASVPAQIQASLAAGHLAASCVSFANVNRKRKSSAPVFSNRMLQNSQIKLTPTPRGGFVNLARANKAAANYGHASKSLNFASPIGRDSGPTIIKKTPILRKGPQVKGAPVGVHFLLPVQSPLLDRNGALMAHSGQDSGLGISPALLLHKENATTAKVKTLPSKGNCP